MFVAPYECVVPSYVMEPPVAPFRSIVTTYTFGSHTAYRVTVPALVAVRLDTDCLSVYVAFDAFASGDQPLKS